MILYQGQKKKKNERFRGYIRIDMQGKILEYVGPDIVPVEIGIGMNVLDFVVEDLHDAVMHCMDVTNRYYRSTSITISFKWITDVPIYRTFRISKNMNFEDTVDVLILQP